MFGLQVSDGIIIGKSIDEVQNGLFDWQRENCIGASDWCRGKVYRYHDGKKTLIGYMSYNGRLWSDKP